MNRRRIALWRHSQIEPLLDDDLTRAERRALLLGLVKLPARWPSGAEREISEATLYRWLRAYKRRKLRGLMPRGRRKKRRASQPFPRRALAHAVALLREEPERSLTMLQALLRAEKRIEVTRSTLHRHLQSYPGYARLRRLAERGDGRRLRRRFEAKEPHHIWQSDSKGPFLVRFAEGPRKLKVHIFSILDDFSRAPLGYACVLRPDLAAAVGVFRSAARRWGLPRKFYADRASIFDSKAFREGLAVLGVQRIPGRARNAPARGKIEAYHRLLERWFLLELRHQEVQDLEHLTRLLAGLLEGLYMPYRHRGPKKSSRELLGGRISSRRVSADRLSEAFLVRKEKKAHPKTGEVELGGKLFRVAADLAGKKLTFAYDPAEPSVAFVELRGGRKRLKPALEVEPQGKPREEKRGVGRLQVLYDFWQGRKLPQAEAGFGVPELFELFAKQLKRQVPRDEFEARSIQDFYHRHGPLGSAALSRALGKIFLKLGPRRPVGVYLEALRKAISVSS
jgi:transposase InsO family protein